MNDGYTKGFSQDEHCQQCKCRCGYYLAREKENWTKETYHVTQYALAQAQQVLKYEYEARTEDGVTVIGPPS